jgi:hypothetical protein
VLERVADALSYSVEDVRVDRRYVACVRLVCKSVALAEGGPGLLAEPVIAIRVLAQQLQVSGAFSAGARWTHKQKLQHAHVLRSAFREQAGNKLNAARTLGSVLDSLA